MDSFIYTKMKDKKEVEKILLLNAAAEGGLEEVKTLVSDGVDPNCLAYIELCYTPSGNINLFGNTISASPSQPAMTSTPILRASENDSRDCLEWLVERGANLNNNPRHHFTGMKPIHFCSRFGNREGVVIMLNNLGECINATDFYGLTALHWACWGGHFNCVEFLLQRGATISKSVHFKKGGLRGVTPLHLACSLGDRKILDSISPFYSLINITKHRQSISLYSYFKIVDLLCKYGANVNERDGRWYTPLHYATSMENVRLLERLLDKGAKMDITNISGISPYDICLEKRLIGLSAYLQRFQKRLLELQSQNKAFELPKDCSCAYATCEHCHLKVKDCVQKEHASVCYRSVKPCPNIYYGCDVYLSIPELLDHIPQCEYYRVYCPYCAADVRRDKIPEHVYNHLSGFLYVDEYPCTSTCPSIDPDLIKCPSCQAIYKRIDLRSHVCAKYAWNYCNKKALLPKNKFKRALLSS